MTIQIKGVLEIDQERGVIYFHANETGHTALRICRLPVPIPDPSNFGEGIDITHMRGQSWQSGRILRENFDKAKVCICKGFYQPVDCPVHGHQHTPL